MLEPEPDWRFTDEIETIELQLINPSTSRRIWVVHYNDNIYAESGKLNSFLGQIWYSWPLHAVEDGRGIVRIDSKRYPRQLVRIQSGQILDGITEAFRKKYEDSITRKDVEEGAVWVFELAPRIEGSH